jgi:hypothetical protein
VQHDFLLYRLRGDCNRAHRTPGTVHRCGAIEPARPKPTSVSGRR